MIFIDYKIIRELDMLNKTIKKLKKLNKKRLEKLYITKRWACHSFNLNVALCHERLPNTDMQFWFGSSYFFYLGLTDVLDNPPQNKEQFEIFLSPYLYQDKVDSKKEKLHKVLKLVNDEKIKIKNKKRLNEFLLTIPNIKLDQIDQNESCYDHYNYVSGVMWFVLANKLYE